MKPSKIINLYDLAQMEAIENVLDPTDAYIHRRICRWYSKTFHTPLHEVFKLDLYDVLTHYYEATMEEFEPNDLYDKAIADFMPDLAERQDQEAEDYAKSLEAEQVRTLAKKGNKTQSLNKDSTINQSPQPEDVSLSFDDETFEDL